jgi:Flp pilus assembly protein TadG
MQCWRVPARERGFALLTLALSLVALVGVLGLCLDLARLYIVRNELQAYADAAAIATAAELNGTEAGLNAAQDRAASQTNRWNFDTARVEDPDVSFADAAAGPWRDKPGTVAELRYARVHVRASVPLWFLSAGTGHGRTIEATAAAGQLASTAMTEDLVPYAPAAADPADPNFGFASGRRYALRAGSANSPNQCDGGAGSRMGLIDLGLLPGRTQPDGFLRQAIVNGEQSHALSTGDLVVPAEGDWETEAAALEERFAQDTDVRSESYEEYAGGSRGNGRRLVTAPVRDAGTNKVLGFAGFFLPAEMCGSAPGASCCAEYVGAMLLPGRKAAGPAGVYRVKLVE